jgi:hypothetical protein
MLPTSPDRPCRPAFLVSSRHVVFEPAASLVVLAVLCLWEEAKVRRGVFRSALRSRGSVGEGFRVFRALPMQLTDGGILIAILVGYRGVDGGRGDVFGFFTFLEHEIQSNDDSFKRTGHSYPEAGILFRIVSSGVKYIRVIAVLRKVST